MAEPKGGPVKPPTLDLKPVRSNTTKPGTTKPAASKPAAPKSEASKSGTAKSVKPTPTPATPKKPARTTTQPSQSSASIQTNSTHPKTSKDSREQSSTASPDFADKDTKSSMSWTKIAIIGALGGAFLALFLIVPLLLSGFLQPAGQVDRQNQIDANLTILNDSLLPNEERTAQSMRDGFDATDQQINDLSQNLAQLQSQTGAKFDQLTSNQQQIAAENARLEEQGTSLQNQIDATKEALATTAPTFDPGAIEQSITALNARFDAIAAGASNEDAEKLSTQIAQIQTELTDLQTALQTQIQSNNSQLANLTTQLEAQNQITRDTSAITQESRQLLEQQDIKISDLGDNQHQLTLTSEELAGYVAEALTARQETPTQPPAQPIQQVPFAMMGIEIALGTGQPFLAQLESLASQAPDLPIEPELLRGATQGLTPPEQIASDFSALMPTIIAARPLDPNANYLSKIGDSVKSILGLRATGLNNGDDFENLLNQTLASIKANKFVQAQSLSALLPDPMRATFPQISEQINLHASIQTLLQTIRDTPAQPSPSSDTPDMPASTQTTQDEAAS